MTVARGFEMTGVGQPLQQATRDVGVLADDEVLVRVTGCGLCHTDLGFLFDGVRTRHALPLILGHEISGVVEAAGATCGDLLGQAVVVPAVLPCGNCEACLANAPMICPHQVMPGNDRDGGFASHVVLPGRGLCPVEGAADDPDAPLGASGVTLRQLSVIADAVSTPYQAVARSGLGAGDLAVVIGLGGVGGYAAQIAAARGAHVVGLDTDPRKLAGAAQLGVGLALDPRQHDGKGLRKHVAGWAKDIGAPRTRWVILECSGTAPGQQTAWDLLVHGATLMVVGFTLAKLELRLSNLMAFDARALGNWGCAPALYPEIVDLALSGQINLAAHTELRPLSALPAAFDDVRAHRTDRRIVLVP